MRIRRSARRPPAPRDCGAHDEALSGKPAGTPARALRFPVSLMADYKLPKAKGLWLNKRDF